MNPAEPGYLLALIERAEAMLADDAMFMTARHRDKLARKLGPFKAMVADMELDRPVPHADVIEIAEFAQLVGGLGPMLKSTKARAGRALAAHARASKPPANFISPKEQCLRTILRAEYRSDRSVKDINAAVNAVIGSKSEFKKLWPAKNGEEHVSLGIVYARIRKLFF
jgi:hypothetical protein